MLYEALERKEYTFWQVLRVKRLIWGVLELTSIVI
jgi:hypothetical protein